MDITLFVLCDEPILKIKVELIVNYGFGIVNRQIFNCDSQILYPNLYISMSKIKFIQDKNITEECILVTCNKLTGKYVQIDKSILSVHFNVPHSKLPFENPLLTWLEPDSITLDSDINLLLQYILSESAENKLHSEEYEKLLKCTSISKRSLRFKFFLFTLRRNGRIREPIFYFDYSVRFLNFIVDEHHNNYFKRNIFLQRFIDIVLRQFRSDGLFGPHTIISFYLYSKQIMNFKSLPIDIPIKDIAKARNKSESEIRYFVDSNVALVMSSISMTSHLALLWGYQSSCHKQFIDLAQKIIIPNQFSETLKIIELRLMETTGIDERDSNNFRDFAKLFFPVRLSSKDLMSHISYNPISLNFLNELIPSLLPVNHGEKNEPAKFAYPASLIANSPLEEFKATKMEYGFANPDVEKYRADVQKVLHHNELDSYDNQDQNQEQDQEEEDNQFSEQNENWNSNNNNNNNENQNENNDQNVINNILEIPSDKENESFIEPIITTINNSTTLRITRHTTKFNISKFDTYNINKISCSSKSVHFCVEKGILYNFQKTNILFCARDVLSVKIPSSVIIIGKMSFENCKKLSKISFEKAENLKVIQQRAFRHCTSLVDVDFNKCYNLEKIEGYAFEKSGLKSLIFESDDQKTSLETIGESAFENCLSLESVKFNKNIKTIGCHAFHNCIELKNVIFCLDEQSAQLESIYDFAFSSLPKLTKIELPISVKYFGQSVFSNCNLKEFKLGNQCFFIPKGFLLGNKNLTHIYFEADTERILKVYYCQNLEVFGAEEGQIEKLNIHSCAKQMLNFDFSNRKTKHPIFVAKNINFTKQIAYNKENTTINFCDFFFRGFDNEKYLVLEKTLKIVFRGFLDGDEIKHIEDDKSITKYDKCAFFTSFVSKITIPGYVKDIGPFCFALTHLLNNIDLTNSYITCIPDFCFFNSSIQKIKIPSKIKSIGKYSFAYSKLKEIEFESSNDSMLKEIKDNAFFNSKIKELYIPDSVMIIGERIISYEYSTKDTNDDDNEEEEEEEEEEEGGVNETKVIIGKNSKLKTIGNYAFADTPITEIYLPETVEYIGTGAFSNTNIKNIKIPRNVHFISKELFSRCSELEKIEFEDIFSIAFIGEAAFSESLLGEFTFPPYVTEVPARCFYKCAFLDTIDFSLCQHLRSIEDEAFFDVPFKKINIPITVSYLGNKAFSAETTCYMETIEPLDIKQMNQTNDDESQIFKDYSPIAFAPRNKITLSKLPFSLDPFCHKDTFKGVNLVGKFINESPQGAEMKDNKITIINYYNHQRNVIFKINGICLSRKKQESNDCLIKNKEKSLVVLFLYTEESTNRITHISITMTNPLLSMLIEYDDDDDEGENGVKFDGFLAAFLSDNKERDVVFFTKRDYELIKKLFKYEKSPLYPPKKISEILLSAMTKICPTRERVNHLFPLTLIEFADATMLTSITLYILLSNPSIYSNFSTGISLEYIPDFRSRNDKPFFKLLSIYKREELEINIVYIKNFGHISKSTQTLQLFNKQLINDSIWFENHPSLLKPDFQTYKNKNDLVFYSFLPFYTVSEVIGKIRRNRIPFGYNPSYKLKIVFGCLYVFDLFISEKHSLANLTTEMIFLNKEYEPKFPFIQNTAADFNESKEVKKFSCLVYEIITGRKLKCDDLKQIPNIEKVYIVSFENKFVDALSQLFGEMIRISNDEHSEFKEIKKLFLGEFTNNLSGIEGTTCAYIKNLQNECSKENLTCIT